jgi:hypothetical protein
MSEPSNIVPDAIKQELLQITAVHFNVAQEYIMITEDKTYRCLRDWKDKIEARKVWIAPVLLLIPLVLTFVTATFRDALGLSKDTWQAVFVLGMVFAGVWTLRELLNLLNRKDTLTVEQLILDLKKGAVVQHTAIEGVASSSQISDRK